MPKASVPVPIRKHRNPVGHSCASTNVVGAMQRTVHHPSSLPARSPEQIAPSVVHEPCGVASPPGVHRPPGVFIAAVVGANPPLQPTVDAAIAMDAAHGDPESPELPSFVDPSPALPSPALPSPALPSATRASTGPASRESASASSPASLGPGSSSSPQPTIPSAAINSHAPPCFLIDMWSIPPIRIELRPRPNASTNTEPGLLGFTATMRASLDPHFWAWNEAASCDLCFGLLSFS